MNAREIANLVKDSPEVQKTVDAIDQELRNAPVMPEDIDEIIKMLELIVEDPNRYSEVRAAAIKDDMIDEDILPPEYNATLVMSILIALYGYRDRIAKQGYARGGLKVAARQVQAAGRGGDSVLVHINPREQEMLRRIGGDGTINPNTGLREYKWLKKILRAAAPVAAVLLAPVAAPLIGGALGFTGTAATIVGGAVFGGATSALTGGDPLKGALLGGLGAGLGNVAGGFANKTLGLGLGDFGQAVLGSGLVGAGGAALTGGDPLKGALIGAAGGALGQYAGNLGGGLSGGLGAGVTAGGQAAGNMLAAGYSPKEAIVGGGLSGLASGLMYKPPPPPSTVGLKMTPSDAVVGGLKVRPGVDAQMTGTGTTNYLTGEQGVIPGRAPSLTSLGSTAPGTDRIAVVPAGSDASKGIFDVSYRPEASGSGLNVTPETASGFATAANSPLAKVADLAKNINVKDAATLAVLSNMMQSRPEPVQEAIQTLSPSQQEYFNRPSVNWDWNAMQNDANQADMTLSEYMAMHWDKVTSGKYNVGKQPTLETRYSPAPRAQLAMGGPMGAVARLARGSGSGRDDDINARLSDGEYVMDAETVSMLGDGSTEAGARRLDQMRAQLRKHKGKVLARGKFSPNAKSPLAYLKGAA